MRVLRTLTGNAAHLPARNADKGSREPFPACTPVGTAVSNGVTRFYFHAAKAVTCKRCLAILDKAETEAQAMHAQYMMTPEGQAQEDALAARRAEKCGRCGSERSNPRHHSAEGHAFTAELPAAEWSGMQVELATGKRYVEAGERVQHKDSGERGTVTAVGPNALDLEMEDGTPRSAASWFWQIQDEPTDAQRAAELEQEGPLSRQLREVGSGSVQCPLLYAHAVHDWFTGGSAKSARRCAGLFEDRTPKLYAPTGEAMTVLGSAVHGGRTGLWGVREGRPLALAFFVDENHLRLQFSAYRPGERARLADATRLATPLATPSQVAELATAIAEQAELFAAGGVPDRDAGAFRSRMIGNVQTLARWLGMSEPVELASYASPYGGPDLVAGARPAHRSSLEVSSARIVEGVRAGRTRASSMPLCRQSSSRWTTYGATCNTPLASDGTCPDQHLHV